MTLDLILACLHHVLVFALAGLLAAELVALRPGLDSAGLKQLGRLDAHYGAVAALIIVVGILRVIYGIKGPEAYVPNPFFWAKMAAFAVLGLLSVPPTLQIFAWRRMAKADAAFTLQADRVRRVRRFMIAEAAMFPLIPIFAAAMARGAGL